MSRGSLGEPEDSEKEGDGAGLAEVDGRPPRGAAPLAAPAGAFALGDVQGSVGTTIRRERHEPTQREALERQLKGKQNFPIPLSNIKSLK